MSFVSKHAINQSNQIGDHQEMWYFKKMINKRVMSFVSKHAINQSNQIGFD